MEKIYFLYGSDYGAISARINEIKEHIGNSSNLTVEDHTLSKLDDIELFLNQPSNLSLFQNSVLLIVDIKLRAFNQLEKKSKEFVDFINNHSSNKFVLMFLCVEKPDKTTMKKISSSLLFKQLKDISLFEEFHKLMPWQVEQIKEKIIQTAKKHNLNFNSDTLDLYADHIKESLSDLEQELKTLSLYLLPNNQVDVKCINDLFNMSLNIDDLFNAIVCFNKPSLLKLSSLLDKVDSPLYVIAALQNKFRQALSVKTHMELNIGIYQISKLLGINSYKLEKEIIKYKNISAKQIFDIVLKLSELELGVKTGVVSNKNLIDLLSIKCIPCIN